MQHTQECTEARMPHAPCSGDTTSSAKPHSRSTTGRQLPLACDHLKPWNVSAEPSILWIRAVEAPHPRGPAAAARTCGMATCMCFVRATIVSVRCKPDVWSWVLCPPFCAVLCKRFVEMETHCEHTWNHMQRKHSTVWQDKVLRNPSHTPHVLGNILAHGQRCRSPHISHASRRAEGPMHRTSKQTASNGDVPYSSKPHVPDTAPPAAVHAACS